MRQPVTEIPITDRFIDVKQVAKMVNVSTKTIGKRVMLGEFPKPRKFGRLNKWLLSTVLKFLAGEWPGDETYSGAQA